jgi:hypothetical protein
VKFSFPFSGSYAAVIHVILKSAGVSILKWLEDVVHEALHIGQGIGWTKAYYSWGIEPSSCLKCHKVLRFVTVSNISVAVAKIKFSKEYHSSHSFNNSINMREGEDIFDRDSIDFLIIEYRVVTPIPFFDVENGC